MVSISRDGDTLGYLQNDNQNDHAAFVQPAIKSLLKQMHLEISGIDAVAVLNGPGSYTGLRVGLASAKGISYALNKPLITISSLLVMAKAMKSSLLAAKKTLTWLCPMIDARRMEVFTAVYDQDLNEIISPCAMILKEDSFSEILNHNKITFTGNGSYKFGEINHHSNAIFSHIPDIISTTGEIADSMFKQEIFSDLAYVEPFYLKSFFNG